jgi:hypothetical protein
MKYSNRGKLVSVIRSAAALGLFCLLGLTQTASAQRQDGGDFEGVWKGTLTMDFLYEVPEGDIERLSRPVDLELRVFGRGGAELYFLSETDVNEWEFSQQRDFRITLVGENNGVIVARLPSVLNWQTGMSINLSFVDGSKDTVLMSWSRISVRNQYEFDGLDEFALSGVTQLQRVDD